MEDSSHEELCRDNVIDILFFIFSILSTYTCKHKIHNHQSYIYLICLGGKTVIIKIKIKKNNETINLTKILHKIAIFNLKKVNINHFVTKRKSMVAFKIRVLLLLSKELSPYRKMLL